MRINFLFLLTFLLFVQQLNGQATHPAAVIPFVFRNNRIIVKLKINESDRILNMLFDTGADGIGMKREVAEAIGLKESRKQKTQVVGATTEIVISEGNTMRFDTLQIKNQNIGIFPNYSDELDGLFGGNFLRNYITEINFDQSVIKLYRFGKITYPDGGCRIPLDYSSGLPGIVAKAKMTNGKEVPAQLYFDSGANYPLIFFGPGVKKHELENGFLPRFRGTTVSLGHQTPTMSGPIDLLELGEFKIPGFTCTLQSYSPEMENWGPGIDGSLGIEIISKFNCFINLPAKEFYLLPNKSFAYPTDFWLGNIQFGFSGEQLVIKRQLPDLENPENQLKEKDVIIRINDNSADDFKEGTVLPALQQAYRTGEIEMIVNRNNSEFIVAISGKKSD